MSVTMTAVMLGVQDLNRSKTFYGDGLGCSIDKDYPTFVSLHLGDGSSSLALYEREAAAQDAGVSSEGSGFRGVSFHFIVESSDVVDDTSAMRSLPAAMAARSFQVRPGRSSAPLASRTEPRRRHTSRRRHVGHPTSSSASSRVTASSTDSPGRRPVSAWMSDERFGAKLASTAVNRSAKPASSTSIR